MEAKEQLVVGVGGGGRMWGLRREVGELGYLNGNWRDEYGGFAFRSLENSPFWWNTLALRVGEIGACAG